MVFNQGLESVFVLGLRPPRHVADQLGPPPSCSGVQLHADAFMHIDDHEKLTPGCQWQETTILNVSELLFLWVFL